MFCKSAQSSASASGSRSGPQRSSRICSSPPASGPIWVSSSAERHWCQLCRTGQAASVSISLAGARISCSAWPPPTVPAAVVGVSTSSAPGARGVAPRQAVTTAVTAGRPPRRASQRVCIRCFMAAPFGGINTIAENQFFFSPGFPGCPHGLDRVVTAQKNLCPRGHFCSSHPDYLVPASAKAPPGLLVQRRQKILLRRRCYDKGCGAVRLAPIRFRAG